MTRQLRRGFSLFEVLVVVAILGFLVGFLMVAVVKARLSAQRIHSYNNLRQIAIACHSYHDANNHFPSGVDANGYSALAHLLPYVEEANLAQQIDFKKPAGDQANDAARKLEVKLFLCPLDSRKRVLDSSGATNYAFCAGSKPDLAGNDGVFCLNSRLTLEKTPTATAPATPCSSPRT